MELKKFNIHILLGLCAIASCGGGASNSASNTSITSDNVIVKDEFIGIVGVWTVAPQSGTQPYTVIRGDGSGSDYIYQTSTSGNNQSCYQKTDFTISIVAQDNYLFNYANGNALNIGITKDDDNLLLTANGGTGVLLLANVVESGIAPVCQSSSISDITDSFSGNTGSFIVNTQTGGLTTGTDVCTERLSNNTTIRTPTRLVNTGALCDYWLDGNVTIFADLIIDPGVGIRANANAKITVDGGRIIADGTAENPIVMDGNVHSTGYWKGIRFYYGGNSVFNHVHMTDAGQNCTIQFCPDAALALEDVSVSLTNSSFSNSSVNGVDFAGDEELVAFSNNRFFNNRWVGIVLNAEAVPMLDANSDYDGGAFPNGLPMPYINGGNSQPQTYRWKKLPTPYYIGSYLDHEQGLWQIDPGVEIILDEKAWISLEYGAVINAIGTAEEPIVFRGKSENAGYWDGISMKGTGSLLHLFEHVVIKDFGNLENLSAQGSALDLYDAQMALNEVTITNGLGDGISCNNPTLLTDGSFVRFISNININNITGVMIEPECNNF